MNRIIYTLFVGFFVITPSEQRCGSPPVPAGAQFGIKPTPTNADLSDVMYEAGSVATFACDLGLELIGNPTISCNANGKWNGNLPFCGSNIAIGKSAEQSSTARGGTANNALDGNRSPFQDTLLNGNGQCSETNKESSPWWMVDLLKPYPVRAVRISTRACCDYKLQDLEIRVGNSTTTQKNPLCAWYPGAVEDGETKVFECAKPIMGQLVSVQLVGVEGPLSLCEVEVFSDGETPRQRCTSSSTLSNTLAFNRTCYEFQLQEGTAFAKARSKCTANKGDLLNHVGGPALELVTQELDKRRSTLKSPMVWLGAQKDPGMTSRTWRWVNGGVVEKPMWGKDQPNNYNGEQNCVVLDGGRDWLWNDVGCNLDYFYSVCQYPPLTCGNPDKLYNSTIVGKDFGLGSIIKYSCPTGSVLLGTEARTCENNGVWTGSAPSCKHVDCGPLSSISNGELTLVNRRTTYNAKADYSCAENYTLVGEAQRICTDKGVWQPTEPKCLYGRCPALPVVEKANVVMSGEKAGDTANYTCDKGYKLEGSASLRCELGGKWTSDPPVCRFINCGPPLQIEHGTRTLLNGTTYESVVEYDCQEDYELEGPMSRTCQDDGTWSGTEPACMLIECGEPEVPTGGYVTGYDFSVHSTLYYFCEKGHLLTGTTTRTCLNTGSWSDDAPMCKYVDCESLPDPANGQVNYINGTDVTYLDSMVTYSCKDNYRLEGVSTRVCAPDGKWTDSTPQCREIRCPMPDRPDGSILTVTSDRFRPVTLFRGSDRDQLSTTFKIDSTVVYKCERGFRIDGENTRNCARNGIWTGTAPTCTYVDCGSPVDVPNGLVTLPNNGTYFGSYAQYTCNTNYKLEGYERRMCLDNGSWSGTTPSCKEISCVLPMQDPTSGLTVSASSLIVGGVATYRCDEGRRLVGQASRVCSNTGLWVGNPPSCEWVDCSVPQDIDNGRVFLVNGSTIFGSVAEYHCIPGYDRKGPFNRVCQADGKWSGSAASCELELKINPEIPDQSLDAQQSDANHGRAVEGSSVGVWVGVAIGLLLVLTLISALCYYRMKRGKWIWAKKETKTNSTRKFNPPNIPLPPTPMNQFTTTTAPMGHINPNSSPGHTGYPYSEEIYATHRDDMENHHMYDLTYDENPYARRSAHTNEPSRNGTVAQRASQRPSLPPPEPPRGMGVTVNGIALC